MAEQQQQDDAQQQQLELQQQTLKRPSIENMAASVDALEAALQPCLKEIEPKAWIEPDYEPPLWAYKGYIFEESMAKRGAIAKELKDDHPSSPPLESTMEKYARDFMKAAKKLQRYFISLQRDDHQPTRAEKLRKKIADMEEELKKKNELIEKQEKVIKGWKMELKDRLDKHNAELERV